MAENATDRDSQLDMFIGWFNEAEDANQEVRDMAERDQQFYHGHQWTQEEISTLEARNQPVVTINRIKPKVDFIYGQEVRTRVDPRTFPMTPNHDEDAIVSTDMLRAVADQVKFDRKRTDTFRSLAVPGIGGVVWGVRKRKRGQLKGKIELLCRPVRYDRFWYDPHSEEDDFSDALYMGVVVWTDFETAKKDPRYKGNMDALEEARNFGGDRGTQYEDKPNRWWDGRRNRVRILEVYYKRPDEDGIPQWWSAHFCVGGILVAPKKVAFIDENGDSYCPMQMVSAYTDTERRRYGMVRMMVSPQEEINKRRSKALSELTNRQVWAEEGSFKDEHDAQTQLAKTDGFVVLQPDALKDGRFVVPDRSSIVAGQFQLMQDAKNDIDQTGPHAALVGASQRDLSGTSIIAQLDAGTQELAPLFDNLRDWTLRNYRVMWFLIKQFKTEEEWLRVRDDDGKGYRFVAINRKMTKVERKNDLVAHGATEDSAMQQVFGQGILNRLQLQAQSIAQEMQQQGVQADPLMALAQITKAFLESPKGGGAPYTQNDVAKLDVDIMMETTPDTAVAQHEEFTEIIKLAGQGVPIPPEVILEASNLREKKKIIAMLKQPPDPAVVQAQQQMMQLQVQELAAKIEKLQADSSKSVAQAAEAEVRAARGVPAEATRDDAQAVKLLAEADEVGNEPPKTGGE